MPELLLSRAIVMWPNLVNLVAGGGGGGGGGGGASCQRSRFHGVLLHRVEARSGARQLVNSLHDALALLSVRRSSYDLHWVGDHDVVVEFATSSSARKCYVGIKDIGTVDMGAVVIASAQLWPSGVKWAREQNEIAERGRREEKAAAKMQRRRERVEEAENSLFEAQRSIVQRLASKGGDGGTGWDDDDGGEGGGRGPLRRRRAAGAHRGDGAVPAGQWAAARATSRVKAPRAASKPANVFGALDDSSEEEWD